MNRLQGKRALVTGPSRGIGPAIARRFSLAGADVLIAARSRNELQELAEGILAMRQSTTNFSGSQLV